MSDFPKLPPAEMQIYQDQLETIAEGARKAVAGDSAILMVLKRDLLGDGTTGMLLAATKIKSHTMIETLMKALVVMAVELGDRAGVPRADLLPALHDGLAQEFKRAVDPARSSTSAVMEVSH